MDVLFNGKFLASQTTGVHRVAHELILAMDALLAERQDLNTRVNAEFILPMNARFHGHLSNIGVQARGYTSGKLRNIAWEQLELPWMANGRTVVSLCNISPMFYRKSIVMIHDAQVYTTPSSYSNAFRIWYKLNLNLSGQLSRNIITVSEYSKSELVKYGIAGPEKISVVHNGCDHILRVSPDLSFLHKSGLHAKNYVLSLATTLEHKNIRVLIEAFHRSELNDTLLVLFGSADGDDFRKIGIEPSSKVRFLGMVSDEELVALMMNARAFASPSLTEGFGLPPLEAMALGCPAVISPSGALPEVCGDAAAWANPQEADDWVRAIRQLIDEPAYSADLRSKGLSRAQSFTWKRAAERLINIILRD